MRLIFTNYTDNERQQVSLATPRLRDYYNKLMNGGAIIMFCDIYELKECRELLLKHDFKQIKIIEMIITNPKSINSTINYLSNNRYVALFASKKYNPVFNTRYDSGMYYHPVINGMPSGFIKELILKHSNINDTIMDTTANSETTKKLCLLTDRKFI